MNMIQLFGAEFAIEAEMQDVTIIL